MDRRIIFRACIALEVVVLATVVTLAYMDYSSGNTVSSQSTGSSQPGVTTTTSFTGGGTIPSGTSLNFGGPTGITIQGNQGLWAGASKLTQAPFSVDLQGNMVANSAKISGEITSGSLTGARIVLDPATGTMSIYNSLGNLVGQLGGLHSGGNDIAFLRNNSSTGSRTSVEWTDTLSNLANLTLFKGVDGGEAVLSSGSSTSTSQMILDSDTAALETNDGTNGTLMQLSNAAGIQLGGTGTGNRLGTFGVTPVVQPNVTGSRASGAALVSLLSALSSLGLITDSTTP